MAEYTGFEQEYEEEPAIGFRPREGGYERSRDDMWDRVNDYVKSRFRDQVVLSGVKLGKTADALKKTAECFNEEEQRVVGEYLYKATNRVEDFSAYLQDTPLERMIEDARECSMKRPALFLGASFSIGVLLARIMKASPRRA